MLDFIVTSMVWTFAFYGVFEVIKNMIYIYSYTKLRSDGIYVVIAVKNQEKKIEGFLRSILFRCVYGKEEFIKDIIVADLDSQDGTKQILYKMQQDYDSLKVTSWKECRDLIENVKEN